MKGKGRKKKGWGKWVDGIGGEGEVRVRMQPGG